MKLRFLEEQLELKEEQRAVLEERVGEPIIIFFFKT